MSWEKERSPKKQINRRRLTKVPGYSAFLPRVFPWVWVGSVEETANCVRWLLEGELQGFALTSHPGTLDGHVNLWLSVPCAESLIRGDLIRQSSLLDSHQIS